MLAAGIEQADMLVEHGDAVGAGGRCLRATGASSPVIRRNRVVLPEPLAPRIAIRSGPRTSNDSGPNRWRSPKRHHHVLEGDQFAAAGQIGRAAGRSTAASGFRLARGPLPAPRCARRSGGRRGGFRARRCFRRAPSRASMNILSSTALGAPGAAGLVAARLLLPRLLQRALGIAQGVRGAARGRPRRGRAPPRALRQRRTTRRRIR